MSLTDSTTTPAKGTKHAHGLSAIEPRVAKLEAQMAAVLEFVTTPPPPVNPTPPPIVPASIGLRVTSVAALLAALADNANTDIVVANGTYPIRGAGFQAANSLWIGARFAGRTNPVTVRAESKGGVIFDGGGSALGGISFNEGAHHQTWDGFTFANGRTDETGVITLGGYHHAPAHHITMRNIRIPASVKGVNPGALDHGIYIGADPGGIHDLLFEDFDIDCGGGLESGVQVYTEDGANGAWNATFRRFAIRNGRQSVLLWDSSSHDILLEDFTITNSADHALSYNHPGQRIILRRVVSTGTRSGAPFDAREGQAGLTLDNCSFG